MTEKNNIGNDGDSDAMNVERITESEWKNEGFENEVNKRDLPGVG